MNIIKNEITIMSTTYDVVELDIINDDVNLIGFIDMKGQTIYIKNKLGVDIKSQTFIHEIIHSILYQTGYHEQFNDERLIDALATGFYSVIKENYMGRGDEDE